jgi:hypothetical protein
MNRANARDILRRRLDEPSVEDFSDVQLNELLGIALTRIQTRIMAFDPSAFMAINRKDLTANQKLYENPADYLHTYFVEVKDATTGLYVVAPPMPFTDTLILVQGATPITNGTQRYARFGRKYIALYPVPTANLADGLQHTYCQHLVMADDNSVPDIPLVLHLAVVIRAQIIAIGETHDDAKNVIAELASIEAEIPTYYQRSGDTPDTLPLDLGKTYGGVDWRNGRTNGVDYR